MRHAILVELSTNSIASSNAEGRSFLEEIGAVALLERLHEAMRSAAAAPTAAAGPGPAARTAASTP